MLGDVRRKKRPSPASGAGTGAFGGSLVLQPRLDGGAVGVVDQDDMAARAVEDRGGEARVAGAAVHPHLALGNPVETIVELVQRDVDRAAHVPPGTFVVAAGVQDLTGPRFIASARSAKSLTG